jgi:Concanavalin A-like lectin/glucanases superfamily
MKTNRQYPFRTHFAWFTALLAAAPRSPAQSVRGNALSLDGVNQYVDVPAGGWFTNGDFTIEAWVYERSYNSWCRVIDFGNGQGQDNVLLALSNGTTGKPSFDVYPENVQVVAPDPIPTNEWVHLAVTFQKTNSDSGTATIYVNGAAVVSGTVMAPNDVTRTDNYIGRSNWAGDAYANAIFDDLRIWNVARSPQEIQADLAAPLTGSEPGLVAYWKFDETNGTTTYDATTNHFDGTLVNGPVWVDSTVGELQATTLPATDVLTNGATLNGTVNPGFLLPATAWFEWGTTTNYGNTTPPINLGATNIALTVSEPLTGLITGTTYHFCLDATNNLGSTFGDDLTFTPLVKDLVINTNDSGPGSLRATIASAGSGDTITFAPDLSGRTILLTSGALVLSNKLTIDASDLPDGITINGNATSRILVEYSGTVVLTALTLTNGYAALSIDEGGGGAIYNNGTLTLNQCTIAGNSTDWGGGGICNDENGTLTVNESTLSGNSDTSSEGGGICNNYGSLTVNQCTIAGNSAPPDGGGGIYEDDYDGSPTLTPSNSIVAGNTAQNIDAGFDASFTGSDNLTSGDPLLAPLGNYGSPTPTMPPLAGSPAIDGCTNGTDFTTDQRGYPRIVGPFADIGAVELQVITATNPPVLTGLTVLGNGTFQFGFTNLTGASFTVYASTNVALPFNQWSNLGAAVETPAGSGQFQFTDPGATNYPQRYYRVTSP